jgi:hypothetical protein
MEVFYLSNKLPNEQTDLPVDFEIFMKKYFTNQKLTFLSSVCAFTGENRSMAGKQRRK